jgi:hypothetical protein
LPRVTPLEGAPPTGPIGQIFAVSRAHFNKRIASQV